ncbi:hypothetical protein TRFO_30655 [Tritrichomonas foetus]|uniref:Sel1 repeat family protein n=1 Tax=Tritrichomonas foetus TaxID=1144522 RepID=A0A1J4JT05_9EUKA|nr:hypothetical protein TRFO_30655 [Tritrichomonas foetus]|eukprot:OHT02249.1 hypothetical protein TRFO_30655 [Tritrichomonas foetus]
MNLRKMEWHADTMNAPTELKPKDIIAIKRAADCGNVDAMYACGQLLLMNGNMVRIRVKEALSYFQKAAEHGHLNSILTCFNLYENGVGIEMNHELSLKYIKMAADHGDPASMLLYSDKIKSGDGAEPNPEQALKYAKMAADKKYTEAMFEVALMLSVGFGAEPNQAEALKYAKMAAAVGDEDGINLCIFLIAHDGIGTVKDAKEVVDYAKIAAKRTGNENIIRMHAYMRKLEFGKRELDFHKMNLDIDAVFPLFGYPNNRNSIKILRNDYIEGMNKLKKLADTGEPKYMNIYALMLIQPGPIVNYNQAIKYFKKAIEKGDSAAKINLQNLYTNPIHR